MKEIIHFFFFSYFIVSHLKCLLPTLHYSVYGVCLRLCLALPLAVWMILKFNRINNCLYVLRQTATYNIYIYIYIYIYICVCVFIYHHQVELTAQSVLILFLSLSLSLSPSLTLSLIIFTNPSARVGYDTRSIFKRSLTGFNSEFSFSLTGYLTKA